jgi:hypothetical protein
VAAVVLEARAALVRLRLLHHLVEGRLDPLVDARRIAAQAGAEVAAAGERPALEARHELVSLPHLDAGAVVVGDRVVGAVEVASAERDDGFELAPRAADLLEPVRDADELHRDLVALHLAEVGHAPRCVYQLPLAPSWKTTVFSPLSSTASK